MIDSSEFSRSRKTKSIPVDSEQYYRLIEIGRKIDVYENYGEAQVDNYESVLKVVLDAFTEENL
jgi:hypothetical protein